MARTLFIGDSHSHGYFEMGGKISAWQSNNYAEIYANHFNKKTVIYSMPGGCNDKYPVWLKTMFDRYTDFDEVFIQSTYWNRFLLSCSRELDVGEFTKSDLFLDDTLEKDDLIHRYTDHRVSDNYVEMIEQPRTENYEQFKGFEFDDMNTTHDFSLFHEKYTYTKIYHELTTVLQYKNYCMNLFTINELCRRNNVKWYLWNINERVFMPDNLDFFGKIDCVRAPMTAQEFMKERFDIDTESEHYRIDREHYIREIHRKIAVDYFGYIKEQDGK